MKGTIVAVCVSDKKGTSKRPIEAARLLRGHGVDGDAHAGTWHRQVSLLEAERVDEMPAREVALTPGIFGENLLTRGIRLCELPIGARLRVGPEAVLQITQKGKECRSRCRIYEQLGDCVMPREGTFARVRRTGDVRPGDAVWPDSDLARVRWAVCTLSDRASAGEQQDASGSVACELLESLFGHGPQARAVLSDDQDTIAAELRRLCDDETCDLIVTTGGTGLSPRDVTPEATLAVIERVVPGMCEAIRAAGLVHTPRAMLSRAVCGQRGQTLILNLSGSPRAVREQLSIVAPVLVHAVETSSGVPVLCARPTDGHDPHHS